ncbi:MAG: MAPEG family protein [Myxococcota bacterium]
MTTPLWCLIIIMFIPIPLAALGGFFRAKAFRYVDNANPRIQAAKLEGIGARTYAAQQNAWEATAIFTATIVISQIAGVSAEAAAPWTIAFVAFRFLHVVCYLTDMDKARSVAFFGGLTCVGALLIKAGSA